MKSCVVQGPFHKVTCKEYHRKYTTPPIFSEYKLNWILCVSNIICSAILVFVLQTYQWLYCIDIGLAATYIFNMLYANCTVVDVLNVQQRMALGLIRFLNLLLA